jgi:hypothetical protein
LRYFFYVCPCAFGLARAQSCARWLCALIACTLPRARYTVRAFTKTPWSAVKTVDIWNSEVQN